MLGAKHLPPAFQGALVHDRCLVVHTLVLEQASEVVHCTSRHRVAEWVSQKQDSAVSRDKGYYDT